MSEVAPRVSVVIPCHNSLRWLPETLSAVRDQSFGDFEVLLIDDGGTDDLVGWAAAFDDERVRVVRQGNAGVAAARNLGITEARGELIALLDSDDLWELTALSALVHAYDRAVAASSPTDQPVGLAYGWHDVFDADGRSNGRVVASRWEGQVWERFVTRSVVGIGAAVVPRSVFADIGGFVVNRDRFAVDVEDWELWIRIAATHRVAVAPELVLHVRRHDENSTGAGATQSLEAAYRVLFGRVFDPRNMPAGDPSRQDWLRSRSVATAETVLAWHSMNHDRDQDAAAGYLRSAARHLPALRWSPEYWRARLSLTALRIVGPRGFEVIRRTSHGVRRLLTQQRKP